jgi:putative transposase
MACTVDRARPPQTAVRRARPGGGRAAGVVGKKIVPVAAHRGAVQFLVGRGRSQRRAGVLLQRPRSTFGDQVRSDGNAALAAPLDERARRHPRDGDRRVWALLRRRAQPVNKKHGHRLWKRAKLQVRTLTRQRQPARSAMIPVQATHPGDVWTDDVLYDHCLQGTPRQVLAVMDAFTRERLAIEVATSLPVQRVLAVLERLVARHGTPQVSRSANGPECMALAVRGWLARHQMTTLDIAPGSPWQHGSGERFHGTVREACVTRHVFPSVTEARVVLASYRRHDHAERPHSRLNDRTAAECKREWLERQLSSMGHEQFPWPR